MKITLNEKGFAIVTSESLSESIELQEGFVNRFVKSVNKMGRPLGSKNKRKIEHRKACPYCGKMVKRLRLHVLQKHPIEYKRLYGETTTGGRSVQDLVENGGWSRTKKFTTNLLD